ncbi:hypothetical protein N7G274_008343 [Stereocaulon virgatum]|uniref:DUF7069 domain-containing protein n=1 Tax=Stereocaulon virgatum TaxID=373712 RepID=A0ABR4A1U1_9LECA
MHCALFFISCAPKIRRSYERLSLYRDNGSQCPKAAETVFVQDALDKCEEQGRQDLIHSLNSSYHTKRDVGGRVKFLVTSRPYFDIKKLFDQRVIRLTGEDESGQIKKEIDLVIQDRVPAIASRKKPDVDTQNHLQERLLSTENRTYIWLYLTLANVEKALGVGTLRRMQQIIDEIPRTVNDAYEAMLDRSPRLEKVPRLLYIVLAAVRPLTLQEMNMALNIAEG